MKIRKTIYEYFSEEEIFWEKTPKELSVIAGKFGMKNDFFYSNQTMGSLSGGEKVKTQLMRLFIRDVSVCCWTNLPMTSTLRRLHYWKKS